MTTARTPTASEADVRMAWWLAEHGRFPTRDALRRIRQYRESNTSEPAS